MRILIIDDDPAGTDILEMLLAPSNATVRRACNGESGIALAEEFKPDLILLDYLMPGLDGLQTTRGLRKFTNAPILILSVLDDPGVLAKVLNQGADDYLVKPVSREILFAHMNNLVRRAEIPYKQSTQFCFPVNRI
ncbi:MAG: response regulator transcription factor [Anaerolineaceae bacterium]